jgi:hypothetical protein
MAAFAKWPRVVAIGIMSSVQICKERLLAEVAVAKNT